MATRKDGFARAEKALRSYALGFPETHEDFPWGERVVKVRKKVFVFMGRMSGGLSVSVKLPDSQNFALMMPFASPTGYGLGRSGWVTARFEPGDDVPTDLLLEWVEESFRTVAPKTILKQLDEPPGGGRASPARKK